MALPTSHNVVTATQLGSTLSSYNTKLNARFKPKQTAVDDPTASGTTTTAIDSISQDANGVITVTKKTISGVAPASHAHGNLTSDGKVGSTADYAVVTTTGGAITATSLATSAPTASGNALSFIDSVSQDSKGKITATKKNVTVVSTYAADGTNPVNGTAVAAAIGTLDVSAITGSASKTLTSISETDGKISATYSNIAIAQSQVTNLTTDLGNKAPKDSPALTGTPTAPTATAGTNTTQIATTAFVKTAVDNAIATADALTYKGTVDGGSTGEYGALTPAASKGDVYKVATAGKIDGVKVEVGDMLVCNTDSTAAATSSNYSTIVANWDFIQTNIDGAVTSSSSSVTTNTVAIFDGTTGKIIKSSGYTIGKSVPSNAVFTDASVTAVGNHYSPATDSSAEKDASGGTATQLPTTNGSSNVQVVTGITMDAKGHVTGVVSKGLWSPNTTYSSKTAASGGTDVSLCTTGEKYTWNNKQDAISDLATIRAQAGGAVRYDAAQSLTSDQKTQARSNIGAGTSDLTIGTTSSTAAAGNHTHTTTLASDTGTSTVTLAHGGKYKLTTGGTNVIFTMPSAPAAANDGALKIGLNGETATSKFTANQSTDSTLTFASGSANGTIAVDGTDVAVTGLGSAAYTESTAYATSGHTHGSIKNNGSIGTTANLSVVTGTKGVVTTANLSVSSPTASGSALAFIDTVSQSSNGQISATKKNILVESSFDPSGTHPVNGQAVASGITTAINNLDAVLYDTAQSLTSTQKTQARTNIGAGTSDLTIGTTSSTAAAGNHTHTTSIATSTGTSSIELIPGGKYSISAGGTSYIFQNGTEMTDQEVTDLLDALT